DARQSALRARAHVRTASLAGAGDGTRLAQRRQARGIAVGAAVAVVVQVVARLDGRSHAAVADLLAANAVEQAGLADADVLAARAVQVGIGRAVVDGAVAFVVLAVADLGLGAERLIAELGRTAALVDAGLALPQRRSAGAQLLIGAAVAVVVLAVADFRG